MVMDILPPSGCIISLCITQKNPKTQRPAAPVRQPDPKFHTKDTRAQAYDQTFESFTELTSQTLLLPLPL